MHTEIARRPICASFTCALSLNAKSDAACVPSLINSPSPMSTRVTMQRTTEGNSPVFQSNEIEYLSTGDQCGINQVEATGLPQSRDLLRRQLPEFLLIETVESLDLQGCSIIQHDVEEDWSQQIQ